MGKKEGKGRRWGSQRGRTRGKDEKSNSAITLDSALSPLTPLPLPVHAVADGAEDDVPSEGVDEWELSDHRREMTRTLNRRAIEIG